MRLTLIAVCGILFLFMRTGVADANAIISSDTGLPSGHTTITFDEYLLPNGTPLDNQYSDYGVRFESAFYNTPPSPPGSPPNIQEPYIVNFGDDRVVHRPLTIRFNSPHETVAFAVISNRTRGNTLFEALLGGTTVELFAARTNFTNANNFFGFTGIVFDEIQISAPLTGALAIDNLQFDRISVAVPEPASLTMSIFGMAGLVTVSISRGLRGPCCIRSMSPDTTVF